MNSASARSALAQKKRSMLMVRIGGLVVLLGASALLWNNLPLLGAVAGAVVLLVVLAFYLVEAQYARELERSLAQHAC